MYFCFKIVILYHQKSNFHCNNIELDVNVIYAQDQKVDNSQVGYHDLADGLKMDKVCNTLYMFYD